MSPDALKAAGEALYGPHWQGDLSRELEIAPRSMRRFLTGEVDIPQGISLEIGTLLVERKRSIEVALQKIEYS